MTEEIKQNPEQISFSQVMQETANEIQYIEAQTRLIQAKIAHKKAIDEAAELGLVTFNQEKTDE